MPDERWSNYAVEYRFKGETYGVIIPARSWDEARERLAMIGSFGRVIGSDAKVYPLWLGPVALFFTRLFARLRNRE